MDRSHLEATMVTHRITRTAHAAVAMPVLEEDRLLGVLIVLSSDPERIFSQSDVESLELLTSTAATVLMALERSRLDGVLLAGRTAEHEVNNQLARVVGFTELIANSPKLDPALHPWAQEALAGARQAAAYIQRLGRLEQLREKTWGAPGSPQETTLNLQERTPPQPS
jgi:signal transduction protein with GAF and PtsI domain